MHETKKIKTYNDTILENEVKEETSFQENEVDNQKQVSTNMLKVGMILIICGWALTVISFITGHGVFVGIISIGISIGGSLIGFYFIKQQRITNGVCICLLGWLTLGLWPIIAALVELKNPNTTYPSSDDPEIKTKMLSLYKTAKILAIIAIPLFFFLVGIIVAIVASYFVGVQKVRSGHMAHGICIVLFGSMTLGIWPLVVAVKQSNRLEAELNIAN